MQVFLNLLRDTGHSMFLFTQFNLMGLHHSRTLRDKRWSQQKWGKDGRNFPKTATPASLQASLPDPGDGPSVPQACRPALDQRPRDLCRAAPSPPTSMPSASLGVSAATRRLPMASARETRPPAFSWVSAQTGPEARCKSPQVRIQIEPNKAAPGVGGASSLGAFHVLGN